MNLVQDVLKKHFDNNFLVQGSLLYTYKELGLAVDLLCVEITKKHYMGGVVALESENCFSCYVKLLALLNSNIPFMLLPSYQFNDHTYRKLLETEIKSSVIYFSKVENLAEINFDPKAKTHNEISTALKRGDQPFIVRTSGTSGFKYKFILHNASLFFNKFAKVGAHFKITFAFSPLESIAGIETLLETVFNGAGLVTAVDSFNPHDIATLISQNAVDYFQTTPSFLNLFLLSGQIQKHNLSSLKKIAYGSEPVMPATTAALKKALPEVILMHTYGMSEIGILKTETNQDEPFKLKINSTFNPSRIINGLIEVQSLTPMIAYLNYENQSLDWFKTGDAAQEFGDYIQVLGREGDLINIAGRKFFPAELEELLMQMPQISDVSIIKEANPVLGSAITAKVFLVSDVDQDLFKINFKSFCEESLPRYMHPQRLIISDLPLSNSRHKKVRSV
ncbi:MAG: fatty acid--CoA ligase family protein [Pseudobdellovibrio sp.]